MEEIDEKIEEKIEELRDLIYEEQVILAREEILDDIVAGLAAIDWTEDLYTSNVWPGKIDNLIDEIAPKIGGEGKFGYMIVYLLQRLLVRERVKITATSWPINETGEVRKGVLVLRSPDDLVEEWKISLYGEEDGIAGFAISIKAQ